MKSRLPLIIAALAIIGLGVGCFYFSGPRKTAGPLPTFEDTLPKEFLVALASTKQRQAGFSPRPDNVAQAVDQEPKFTSNGCDKMHVAVPNPTGKPMHFVIKAGDIYENGRSRIVALETLRCEIGPGLTLQSDLRVAAASIAKLPPDDSWQKSTAAIPHLGALIALAATRPGLSHEVVQTAVLALSVNPTMDTFAKFPRPSGGTANAGDGDFTVNTGDIVAAAALLSEIGVTGCAFTADPQLKVEAMLDPASHDAAMRYYGIAPAAEWDYWKNELLNGAPQTRHYALYGIAAYFPDVALKMLPQWARATQVAPIYRLSAVRALAMVRRPGTVQILEQLKQEFGEGTELYDSADRASKYLGARLSQSD